MSIEAKMVKMADQIANTIDCVDVFMLKANDKSEIEKSNVTETLSNEREKNTKDLEEIKEENIREENENG